MKKLKFNTPKNLKKKIIIALLLIGVFLAIAYVILVRLNEWYDTHRFVFHSPVEVNVFQPIKVEEREIEMISPEIINIIQEIPAPEDLETDPEKLIYKYFGIEHYRMAIAVSRCEGLNHPADGFNVNTNGSIDVGYMRINSINFKLPGCSLLEVATPEGNIACGYKMWDRGDGEEGNKKGNFNAWVGYTNGCALTKYE